MNSNTAAVGFGRPHALHCILPPFLLARLAASPDEGVRRRALEGVSMSAEFRAARTAFALAGAQRVRTLAPPRAKKHRLVYDAQQRPPYRLPGRLVRSEGDPRTGDPAADEAYTYSGNTYDFYKRVFQRNSIDDNGMAMISSVHVGKEFDNAFWNGRQMAYGDGDGVVFRRFTRSLDVCGHELSHGVIEHTSNLQYWDEPGALNEHFADVFGILIKQWKKRQTAKQADWLVGKELIIPAPTRSALRSMAAPGTAYQNDPHLGDDPQPAEYQNRYRGSDDNGGVHINSGIPNHAFYLLAMDLGGRAWEKAGRIWYEALLQLRTTSSFAQCAVTAFSTAGSLYGAKSREQRAVQAAWKAVGIAV